MVRPRGRHYVERVLVAFALEGNRWAFVKRAYWLPGGSVRKAVLTQDRAQAARFTKERGEHLADYYNRDGCYGWLVGEEGTLPTPEQVAEEYGRRKPAREHAERVLSELLEKIAPVLDKLMI